MGDKASKVIPAIFYFSLLSRSMTLNMSKESRTKLQDPVASLLHLAQVEDFFLPLSAGPIVAKLWDRYLSQVAMDPKLEPSCW